MCLSTPDIPPPPPPVQDVKQPDSAGLRDSARRNRGGMAAPSLLTGPSGAAAAPTGRSTLLGQ